METLISSYMYIPYKVRFLDRITV